jgi:single stranded DNA-binding protein
MKTIILDGRVGTKGTEVKSTKAGKPYAHFSIANNTFSNGEEKTEWYDVISYDPAFIEKRAQYLGKGSYVIVTGSIRTEVKVGQDNKMWVNHYITATNIDTPRLGVKPDNDGQVSIQTTTPTISTFTGGTASDISTVSESKETYVAQVSAQPQPQLSVVGVAGGVATASASEDDLPF